MATIKVKNPVNGSVFTVNESEYANTYAPLGWTVVGGATSGSGTSAPVATAPTSTVGTSNLKNQGIASANPSSVANKNYVNALYQEAYGRPATQTELDKFSGRTVKDATNIILGQAKSPFAGTTGITEGAAPITGGVTDATGANNEQINLDKQINDYIDSLGVTDEYKQILRTVAKDQYTTGVTIKSADDIDKIIKNATVNAEASLTPYYDKVGTQNIEDLKRSMGEIRREASNYLATEKLTYSDLLDKTRKSLRARGLTFSGEMRKTLGAEGAINAQGVEGTQPTERRLGVESAIGRYQSTAADTGTKYERILGSGNQDIKNLGTIENPYATGTTYSAGATTDLYKPLGTTSVGSAQLEREKAIEERKQANLRALTQQ